MASLVGHVSLVVLLPATLWAIFELIIRGHVLAAVGVALLGLFFGILSLGMVLAIEAPQEKEKECDQRTKNLWN